MKFRWCHACRLGVLSPGCGSPGGLGDGAAPGDRCAVPEFSAISQKVSQKVVAIATNLNYYPRDVAPCPDDDAPNDVLYLLAACVVWWPERTKLEQFDRA